MPWVSTSHHIFSCYILGYLLWDLVTNNATRAMHILSVMESLPLGIDPFHDLVMDAHWRLLLNLYEHKEKGVRRA